MGTTERRNGEIAAIKKKILDATNEILLNEGYEKLSIRKIAERIEYSPGNIYHYFKDKEEIIAAVVDSGYKEILQTLREAPVDRENPDITLVNNLKAYIRFMLASPEKFRVFYITQSPAVEERINILSKGVSENRESIKGLCQLLVLAMKENKFRKMDVELTAQILWTSTHGLISRLIAEKNIDVAQQERLIEHHFELLLNGIRI